MGISGHSSQIDTTFPIELHQRKPRQKRKATLEKMGSWLPWLVLAMVLYVANAKSVLEEKKEEENDAIMDKESMEFAKRILEMMTEAEERVFKKQLEERMADQSRNGGSKGW